MNDFADDLEDLEEDNTAKPIQVAGRIRMAFTRWWIILVFAILGYVVALYTLSIAEPSHRATAVLEVVTKERQLVGEELEMDKLAVDKTLKTVASKLIGPSQLTKVVNSAKIQSIERAIPPVFSFKPKYWRTEEELSYKSAAEAGTTDVVKMITNNVKVAPRAGTTLIDITVTHKDEESAIAIADSIMEEYLKAEYQRKTGGKSEAFTILRTEANGAAQDLETAQRAIEFYKSVMGTNDLLKRKRSEMVLLRQRYKSKHPKMKVAQATYDDLAKLFRREIQTVMRNASELTFWSQHEGQLAEYEQKFQARDEAERKEAEEQWLSLVQSVLSARVGLLQGRIANKQALYDTLTKRITEIDVAEENNQGEIKIAERAYLMGNTETDRYLRLAQGLGGGVLIGFGIAYLLGMLDYKIYDVRTVEMSTGLPCLAAIPDGVVFDLEDEWQNVLEAEPNTANAEAIRNLRASVMLLGKAERHKTMLVTSAAPGEGKTTVASELAAAFALNGQKTVLVDLDLRKPRVHTLFPQLENEVGLSDVLAGQIDLAKVVQKTSVEGLHVICTGSKAPNPSELLQENEVKDIIGKLSQYYDRVVIDTPPVLPVSDTRLLVRHVQTVLLVVRALKAPFGAVMRAKVLLEAAQAPIAGVVINAIKRKHIGSGYYGYHGYGEYGGSGGYGGYYDDEKE